MRLRGEDGTGGERLSILIYTQIFTPAYSSPFFSLLLCSFPLKMLPHIKPSTQNGSICSAPSRHLSVFFVRYSTSQMSIHCATFRTSQPHPSHCHAPADFTSFSVCILLSVILFRTSLLLFRWCLCYSISLPLPLYATGGSGGLSEEKYRFK